MRSKCCVATLNDLPGNSSIATTSTAPNARFLARRGSKGRSIKFKSMLSSVVGGCDFGRDDEDAGGGRPMWTAAALPTIVALATAPTSILNPDYPPLDLRSPASAHSSEALDAETGGAFNLNADTPANAVLLPLDDLFEVRLAAALRVWQRLNGRVPEPAIPLSPQRSQRLILALRALDGRLDGATHRQIAAALFGAERVAGPAWISHDLRDRTARLVRLGVFMMKGGYRQLLVHPHRRLPHRNSR